MTKCMRIKTPHSVLHLLKQNLSYKYCDSANTGLPLTPCALVCVHVLSYRTEVPGAWGAWGSGVGRCWPLTQNWRRKATSGDCIHHCSSGWEITDGTWREVWRYLLLMGRVLVSISWPLDLLTRSAQTDYTESIAIPTQSNSKLSEKHAPNTKSGLKSSHTVHDLTRWHKNLGILASF